MNVILIYDIVNNKSDKIKKICRKYLNHIQYSVFEGNITYASLKELKMELNKIIEKNEDSIIIYKINNPKWVKKDILGKEKNDTSNFI